MGAFQSVRQIDAGDAGDPGPRAPILQGAADAQFADGVGACHQLKAVEIFCQLHSLRRHGARPLFNLDAFQGVFNNAQEVSPGAAGGVQGHHILTGEPPRFAEAPQQLVGKPHLGVHHLHRRVVGPGVFAQLRVVSRQKVLVEVKPRILRARQLGDWHDGNDAQQQV